MLAGLRRKPGSTAAKGEYGEWKVTGSNLLYLDYKETEEEHIEEAPRKSGDRSIIKFWNRHDMCLLNGVCRCEEAEKEDEREEEAELAATPCYCNAKSDRLQIGHSTSCRLLRRNHRLPMLRKWPHAMQKLAVQRWASMHRLYYETTQLDSRTE